jgi:hypothetical protein
MSEIRKEYDEFFKDAIGRNPEPISVIGYDAWLASQLLASREEVARLRELLGEVVPILKDDIEAVGPCEHDVNICVCGLKSILASIAEALSASPSPAKTCRWTWEPGSGYYTCKGSVAAGVGIGMLKELGYLYCHSCGLPIEEVKEETT